MTWQGAVSVGGFVSFGFYCADQNTSACYPSPQSSPHLNCIPIPHSEFTHPQRHLTPPFPFPIVGCGYHTPTFPTFENVLFCTTPLFPTELLYNCNYEQLYCVLMVNKRRGSFGAIMTDVLIMTLPALTPISNNSPTLVPLLPSFLSTSLN